LAADAGTAPITTSGDTTNGSPVLTNIPSTAGIQPGWSVAQTSGAFVIPAGTTILSIDSPTQITLSRSASGTATGIGVRFGGLFSKPTQLFDFDPFSNAISPVSPAIPDLRLNGIAAYVTRMLILPTGQLLFSDASNQLWVYTPDGQPDPALRPVINDLTYNGSGVFSLTGQQLNGQSAGSAYGDDVQSEENYPLVRLTNPAGQVYYCRTTDWNSSGVSKSGAQSVNFTLNPSITAGNYVITVSGAGISSFPMFVSISQSEIDGK
jgi:hypothetical protein